jgi:hypothetical protein
MMKQHESFVDRHIVAIMLIVIISIPCGIVGGVLAYASTIHPTIATLNYTGTLQSMSYDENGFGTVLDSVLHFPNGIQFTVNNYYVYTAGLNYTITYQTSTWPSGHVTTQVLNVTLE